MENINKVDTRDFCKTYLNAIFDGVVMISKVRNRFPELHSNENALAEYIALGEKPYNYDDSSSTLILILFEMTVVLDAPELYNLYRGFFVDKKIDLQTYYPDINDNTELLLFEREIKDEGYSETTIELPEKYDDFVEKIKAKPRQYLQYRTIAAGHVHLKYLAHAYYKSPFIPTDWREFIFEKKG